MSRAGVKTYRYMVEGLDVNNESFLITGYVDALPGDIFGKVWEVVGAEVFMKLTNGQAVYGKPGEMCKGPYKIRELRLRERTETE